MRWLDGITDSPGRASPSAPQLLAFSPGKEQAAGEYSGLISFRMDWLDLLAVQETLKSLLQHHSSKASIFWYLQSPALDSRWPNPRLKADALEAWEAVLCRDRTEQSRGQGRDLQKGERT